jgi:3',5'-cyclic AMP phosphodiesterase CpdA
MGLVVHLTDLHLGPKGAGHAADDAKVRVISEEERTSIRDLAEEKLRQLAEVIKARGQEIAALVISGDITVQGGADGYAELAPFLIRCFGDMLPEATRIVATPGNHDVAWYEADPHKRYQHFITYCVKKGYVTPPLEGVDLGSSKAWSPSDRHILVEPEEGWFIVPLNTSNWSGSKAELVDADNKAVPESEIRDFLTAMSGHERRMMILKQLLRHRQYDMARVSKKQIDAFRSSVGEARIKMKKAEEALAVAVLHHQLSPVNEREEIKPFEALSNLGRVRTVLGEQRISLALHGHKHDPPATWNITEAGSEDGRAHARHEMLVVSGGTIGGTREPKPSLFATVIEITSKHGGHDVRVQSVGDYINDATAGTRAYFQVGRRIEPVSGRGSHVEAKSFDEGYARLLHEGAIAGGGPIKNLSITLTDLSGVDRPPIGYPADAAGEGDALPLEAWFSDVAKWWQSELLEAPRGLFTHGRRLRLHRGKPNADQIEAMIKVLVDRRPTNGRAIATLVDADTDMLSANAAAPATFPAFCLVQLHLEPDERTMLLNATAYFRKQEMRYWWPVNMSEIRHIMETALKGIKDARLGSITTVAAVAVWQTARSRVSVPAVDRMYLQDESGRADLMRMAAVLAQPANAQNDQNDRRHLRNLWAIVLEDLVPPAGSVRDSIPVAVEGVRFLASAVRAHASVVHDPEAQQQLVLAATCLDTLAKHGRALWELSRKSDIKHFDGQLSENVEAMRSARDSLTKIVSERLPMPGNAAVSEVEP